MYLSNDKCIEKRVAREILNIIEQIYYGKDYMEHRINYGSNGTIDLILSTIADRYDVK